MTDHQTDIALLEGAQHAGGQTIPDLGTVPEPGTVSSWLGALMSSTGPAAATTRHVLTALALHWQADPDSNPDTDRLSVQTGVPEPTVRKHLEAAEADGWIRRNATGQCTWAVPAGGKKRRRRRPDVTFREFIAACHKEGVQAIPATDPIFRYADRVGIQDPWLELAWKEFCEKYENTDKRYKDWRQAFRNCVQGNWFRLWWAKGGESGLTTAGEMARRKHGVDDDIYAGAI